jgi:hypothetical protein
MYPYTYVYFNLSLIFFRPCLFRPCPGISYVKQSLPSVIIELFSDWESEYAKDDSLLTFWINMH